MTFAPELIAALSAGNLQAFETLLKELQSNDNDKRSAAETVFDELKKTPDVCIQHLLQALRSSTDVQCKVISAILLRKVRLPRRTAKQPLAWLQCRQILGALPWHWSVLSPTHLRHHFPYYLIVPLLCYFLASLGYVLQ